MQLACVLSLLPLLTAHWALAEDKPQMAIQSLRTDGSHPHNGYLCRSGNSMVISGNFQPQCAIYLDDDGTLVYQGTNLRIGYDSNKTPRLIDTSTETTPYTQFTRYVGVTPGTESLGYMYVAMPKNDDGSPGAIGYVNDNGDASSGIDSVIYNYWKMVSCPGPSCTAST
ncbi:hypothetical protein BJ684DRAFT_17710 [Piptocephalis cylindrospora]|uniref:Uncharacterized protein n=1 Tax=Piptocephalis cylindrospora TaxID=1907219 RepID=A0A4P9XZ35_9FUNG|nr:hypothetical protein BJ684DRAFT_17710 [Piptocephalis cylindrospora]|eukprot:RKP11723.1 hypothetical protein BJ684DRAFT_17710 [Piptocephalis cylindrospora]